jgi:dihydroorotate dehydrogenase (fumarate)
MEFRTDVTLGMKNPLSVPLMNGGGCCKTVEDVKEMAKSAAGGVVYGAITLGKREFNPGETFWPDPFTPLNSLGMPNGGREYWEPNLPEMVRVCHGEGKIFAANVAGFNPKEYAELTYICASGGVDVVELNLGCGNVVVGDDSRKPIPAYDDYLLEDILCEVRSLMAGYPIWLKMSYNPIMDQIKRQARIIAPFGNVNALTLINTLANCYMVDKKGESRIGVGLAGMSGPAIRPAALGSVKQWRKELPETIAIIGVGGIKHGEHIKQFMNEGAAAFQMTTEVLRSGRLNPNVFERVIRQFDGNEVEKE